MRLPSATHLLADGIVQVLRALARLTSCELTELAEEVGCARYVQGPSLKGQADIDWTDSKARQGFLAEIITDADQLLELVRGTRSDLTKDSPEDQELVAAAGTLARILAQDIQRDENGPRLTQGVASDRLISVHDPEMRHGRKSSSHRFNGHKAQVAVDTDSQLITAVEVLPGNAADADHALEVVKASEVATGCEVEEVIGDCAYGAGDTRAEFAASGRTLVAKVPEIQNQGYFTKTDFQIDLEAGTCTCPNTQQTRDFRPAKRGGGMFVFATETCAACPVRAQCTRGQGGRTVQVHPQEALLQQARELQASPAFDDARRRRQVVEHRLARLVQLGIRQARYIGRTKTLFQLCIAAAVANLTLLTAASDALSVGDSAVFGWTLTYLTATLSLASVLLGLGLIALIIRQMVHRIQFIHPMVAIVQPLRPPFRPGF